MATELDQDDIFYLSEFEKITKVIALEYHINENAIFFVVDAPDLGKAIGKNALNIERLSRFFNKRAFVIADFKDIETFIRGFFNNVTILLVEIVNVMGEQEVILTVDEQHRGLAIGKNGDRIKALKALLKKRFNANLNLRTRKVVG